MKGGFAPLPLDLGSYGGHADKREYRQGEGAPIVELRFGQGASPNYYEVRYTTARDEVCGMPLTWWRATREREEQLRHILNQAPAEPADYRPPAPPSDPQRALRRALGIWWTGVKVPDDRRRTEGWLFCDTEQLNAEGRRWVVDTLTGEGEPWHGLPVIAQEFVELFPALPERVQRAVLGGSHRLAAAEMRLALKLTKARARKHPVRRLESTLGCAWRWSDTLNPAVWWLVFSWWVAPLVIVGTAALWFAGNAVEAWHYLRHEKDWSI